MTVDEIIKAISEKLIILPDQTGLARCAGFYMLYQGIESLKQALEEERKNSESEKKALMDRLNELEKSVKGE